MILASITTAALMKSTRTAGSMPNCATMKAAIGAKSAEQSAATRTRE